MRRALILASLAAAIVFAPGAAQAQERFGDGILGAAAGAAVGGPIGAAVGGIVGFTSGPRIASGLGLRHRWYYRRYGYWNRYPRYAYYRRSYWR
ncbi:MAG: hypothetical protein JO366_00860 [Methylobacteriaceae bacterium]|nr:hypothetical protein [Methylobacteriaceae bacterium]MBV9243344.1 hypothetical protein [Methylobacteriaceae bacterium]MBV9636374.1 hypothetical protein [Methylobacteriaceae bacterium]MBV9705546.1 hypothetical protein [Methylobacteriaceae bacterium]